ncbi:LexA repressor [compost metagenome]
MILVDTEADACSGKLVVAKLTDSNEATFKKLIEDAGRRFLKPLNPDYPMIQINGNCKIIGVVVRAMMKLRAMSRNARPAFAGFFVPK